MKIDQYIDHIVRYSRYCHNYENKGLLTGWTGIAKMNYIF